MYMNQEKRHTFTHLMLERLIKIHKEIRSGTYPNTKQLAEKYNEGKGISTISRDIEFLRDRFFAPIEYDYFHKGYYYTDDFEMPLNVLDSEKLQSLFAAKQLLIHFKESPIYQEISSIIDFLSDLNTNGNSKILNRITVPPIPKFIVDTKILNNIYIALQSNNIIEFDYKGRWDSSLQHRKVRHYQLILDDGQYFLYGFSEEKNDVRIFSLGRMENLIVKPEVFTLPSDYEFENKRGSGRFGSFVSDNLDTYKIEFYDHSRIILKSFIWADDQIIEDDDSRNCTTITFTSTQSFKIEEWVLAQGMYAKPLEPEWLVNSWKENIKEMLKLAGL